MIARKKEFSQRPTQQIFAASWVVFLMIFMMLFLPFFQLLVGCKSIDRAIHASGGYTKADSVEHQPESTVVQAIREAEVGGIGGDAIAAQMKLVADVLQESMKEAVVKRVGEGILITLDSRALFNDDCVDIHPAARNRLKGLVKVLDTCKFTNVLVEVHTDNTAEKSYNFLLTRKRATAIEKYLENQGVKNARIHAQGYGETQPLVSNDDETGKRRNRRVEIVLSANKEMKMLALKDSLGSYFASKQ